MNKKIKMKKIKINSKHKIKQKIGKSLVNARVYKSKNNSINAQKIENWKNKLKK